MLQAQQLQVQISKAGEEAKASNLRVAQLQAALEEKTVALEAAEVCVLWALAEVHTAQGSAAARRGMRSIHHSGSLEPCLHGWLSLPSPSVRGALQEELRSITGSKFSREAFVVDLQGRLAEAAKAKAAAEAELRQVRRLERGRAARRDLSSAGSAAALLQGGPGPAVLTGPLRGTPLPPQSQLSEKLADAQDEAAAMREQIKAGRERAEAAELGAVALKKQLAEKQREVEARERSLQVRTRLPAAAYCAADVQALQRCHHARACMSALRGALLTPCLLAPPLQDAAADVEAREGELAQLQRTVSLGDASAGALSAQVATLQSQLTAAKEEAAAHRAQLNAPAAELESVRVEAAERAREAEQAVDQLKAAQGAVDRSKNAGADEVAEVQANMRKVRVWALCLLELLSKPGAPTARA